MTKRKIERDEDGQPQMGISTVAAIVTGEITGIERAGVAKAVSVRIPANVAARLEAMAMMNGRLTQSAIVTECLEAAQVEVRAFLSQEQQREYDRCAAEAMRELTGERRRFHHAEA